jgi:hypothetical protein
MTNQWSGWNRGGEVGILRSKFWVAGMAVSYVMYPKIHPVLSTRDMHNRGIM